MHLLKIKLLAPLSKMPLRENKIQKKYFSIGEVSEKLGLSTSLIRFWETEFDVLNPKKNKKGLRKYTVKDIDIIQQIFFLLKNEGFTIEGAKKAISKRKENKENNLILRLNEIRKSLVEIRKKI